MAFTESQVLEALSHVVDPDLGRDLVTLNMVQDVSVDGSRVSFTVVLTTPACPLKEHLRVACTSAIHERVDENAQVEINMTANVTSRASAEKQILPGVKNTIAVASGKGGVGKSTIAANLAVALAMKGARVGLVDTDIYGPSVPTMFGVAGERPRVNEERLILPLERFGVKLLSMGFLVDSNEAVVWRGPMVTSAVRQFLEQTAWGELDYLILDLPPGTGDIQLTLVQTIPLSGAVIVTTPQEVALADARKGVAMFRKVNVPVLGIVENMAYFTPPDLPDRKYYLFGEGGGKRLAQDLSVPLLGEIPLLQTIREASDDGFPVVLREDATTDAEALRAMAERVAQEMSIRNASDEVAIPLDIVYQ
ncbi:MAG: Mrp/NBP35 family ATP-binding protein [Rhodothermales bacterium]